MLPHRASPYILPHIRLNPESDPKDRPERTRRGSISRRGHDPEQTSKPNKYFYFTVDCDWIPGSHVGLESLLKCCDRAGITATIFFAGRFAEAYPDLVRACFQQGHQLGTHGWAHGSLEEDEDFRIASYEQQRQWIRNATEAVEKATGVRPVVFRAPNLWISETTLRVLEEEGYRYDSSVPAMRFDMGLGRVHYAKYFWAPRDPYRPSRKNLNHIGDSPILEVPPSSCLFPINLAMLRTLGFGKFQRMIQWIERRSRHLVFYCHPSEFVFAKNQCFPESMSKWNQKGMCPANITLIEDLVDYALASGYISAQMRDAATNQLDSGPPIILRTGSFPPDRTYRQEGAQ